MTTRLPLGAEAILDIRKMRMWLRLLRFAGNAADTEFIRLKLRA
jgi:hypothetical protein